MSMSASLCVAREQTSKCPSPRCSNNLHCHVSSFTYSLESLITFECGIKGTTIHGLEVIIVLHIIIQ